MLPTVCAVGALYMLPTVYAVGALHMLPTVCAVGALYMLPTVCAVGALAIHASDGICCQGNLFVQLYFCRWSIVIQILKNVFVRTSLNYS